MFYIVESSKSFYEVTLELEPVIQRLGFVLLHSHDMGEALRQRDIDFDEECQTFDVCNYRYAEKILNADIRQTFFIPWRISAFTENGVTLIGLLRPSGFQQAATTNPKLAQLIREIEEKLIAVIDEMR